MSYKPKICQRQRCGEMFTPDSGTQKYCTSCQPLVKKERYKKYPTPRECVLCHNMFTPHSHNPKERCTACRTIVKKEWNDARPRPGFEPQPCEQCHTIFVPRKGNSKWCDMCRPIRGQGFQPKECAQCHMMFMPPSGSAKWCDVCRPMVRKELIKKHGIAQAHNRRAREMGNGGTHSFKDENDLLTAQKEYCFYCDIEIFKDVDRLHPQKAHVEHIKGIANGGSNSTWNIVYSCKKCNDDKQHRLANCAEALILELVREGKISGSQAFKKSHTLKLARERKYNPVLFVSKLKAEYCG